MINIFDHVGSLINAIFVALIGAIGVLVRKVLTNEKEIKELKASLKAVQEVKEDVKELRADIKNILYKMYDTKP